MTQTLLKTIFISILLTTSAYAADGVINVASKHSVEKTANNLENILLKKGMTVFKRVHHSTAAAKVGITLNPSELIIFGNPKIGSPLMKCSPSVAIDLPQKALIWQDNMQKVWITYNDPSYLKQRHNIKGCDKVLNKISGALSKLTGAAAK